jgi:hypothetical protein
MRDGSVIDADVIEPLTAARIVAFYLATTREPKAGKPHVPGRVRVASPEVAEMLRAAVGPGVEVVSAPTPEFDALQAQVKEDERRRVADDGSGETYLGPGVKVGGVSRFFTFAARLYRVAPWDHVPDDNCLIGVTCEKLGLDGAVLAVMGQDQTDKGFLLFRSHQAFLDYMAIDFEAAGEVPIPPHLALTYGRGADLGARRRKEISVHGFEVADAHAYPSLLVLDEVLPRAPDAHDLELAGAVASGLIGLVENKPNLHEAWRGKGAIQTFRVQTTKGRLEMTLSVPHDAAEALRRGLVREVRRVEKQR